MVVLRHFLLVFFLIEGLVLVNGTHFRGGIISWRALNTTPSGSTAQILVHQRYAWRRNYTATLCDDTMINTQGFILNMTGSLTCNTGGSCGSFATISADVHCTDYSVTMNFALGERYNIFTLPLGATFIVGFYGGNWLSLAMLGGGAWQTTNQINLSLRPDGRINTSPVTSTLPVIYRTINVQHVHVIQMADAESTDILRCRWSTATGNPNNWDECGSVCAPTLPSYTLIAENCTLVFTITTLDYYAVALQIEDFYNAAATIPMSSVPIQFLFYGVSPPGGCSTPPSIIGVRPNLACIGTPINQLTNETVIAQIGCPGKSIVEFTTSSPMYLTKSAIMNPSTGIYVITLLFIPIPNQYGPQAFCAAAVDDTNVQSDAWCITFLVGFDSPDLQPPILVQGSASPIGTVFANQSIFSIQSKNGAQVNRPGHNGTYISFHDATLNGTVVLAYDCGWSPNVIYSSDTVIIYAPYTWVPGHLYYVTLDSGASSGNDFCHAESAPISSPTFWQFDIWNPALSSTTTTTTTPPTTHTITTRSLSTTTPIANLTTTGIIITTPPVVLTSATTATSSTSTATAVAIATVPSATTELNVLTALDFVESCKQPVAIGTLITILGMVPIHMIGMYTLFIKVDKMLNPDRLLANQRGRERRIFANRVANKPIISPSH